MTVAEVAVVGVPDDRWGERVHAVVVPAVGATPTEQDVIDDRRLQGAQVGGRAHRSPPEVLRREDPQA
jgi:acyl-CoA synthetase (AMP-forming)/AMP-acid ligase II